MGSVATRGVAQLKLAAIAIIASAVVVAAVLALVFLSGSIEFTPPAAPARPVSALASLDNNQPIIFNPKLKATLVADGLDFPTSMAFVDNTSTILTLEKNTGKVMRISGGVKKPILQLSVAKGAEQGLIGITVEGTNSEYMFLYYIETNSSGNLLGNRIYCYEWDAAQRCSLTLRGC